MKIHEIASKNYGKFKHSRDRKTKHEAQINTHLLFKLININLRNQLMHTKNDLQSVV